MQQHALIVGYGSPIRGDDAIGPLVADRLAEMALPHGIEVQARHILTAELVDDLHRVSRVIFIDAAADTPPGEVRCRRLQPDATAMSTMAHFHDPRELLAWCEALYGEAPEAWLVSAGGAEWGYTSYELSDTARAAVEPMIACVLSRLGLGPGAELGPELGRNWAPEDTAGAAAGNNAASLARPHGSCNPSDNPRDSGRPDADTG
ncbi:MAG: hydrogenase maturation protease [Thiohalocapsa sp.]|nr:hydrogenase maturation protease [Thiohalocapsa sp.]MCF7989229.1 hydrogenase maturation protease [Thiohalocapsa sp.]